MTTLKQAGYFTTEAALAFNGTKKLNSCGDNEYTDLSDEIDNSTNLYELADLRAVIASKAFTLPADCGIEIYLIPTEDGTTYPTWVGNISADTVSNNQFYVGYIPFTGATGAQAGVLLDVALPSGKYKWAVRNRGNVALETSGNTIYWRPHSHQSV